MADTQKAAPPAIHDLREAVAGALYDAEFPTLPPIWTWATANERERSEYLAKADILIAGSIASEHARLTERAEKAEAGQAERQAICAALGCIDKPGLPLEFVKDLQRQLTKSYARNDELLRSWDRATPTERQELDRMRRGWGPSSPTERARRQEDVAVCVRALGGALTELSVSEEDANSVPEEAQAYLDAAHDRVEKAYFAAIAVTEAIRKDPDEWPDIKAAEERGAFAAEDELTTLKAAAARDAEVIARMRDGLKAAEQRFSDISAGWAFQPRLHAATGATEARAILTSPENADV